MRKLLTILIMLLGSVQLRAQVTLQASVQNAIPVINDDGSTGGIDKMYVYLPWDYYTSGKDYPIIFFWTGKNGTGNGGTDLSKLKMQDLPYQIDNGHPPYSVDDDGDTTRFIVTTFQPLSTTHGATENDVLEWVGTIKNLNIRVDSTRMYYMGASQGGGVLLNYAHGLRGWIPSAVVDANPQYSIGPTQLAQDFEGIPCWFFQDDDDEVVGQNGTNNYGTLHGAYPNDPYRLTQYVGSHAGPERTGFFAPTWNDSTTTRNSPQTDSVSIFDYVLRFNHEYIPVPEGTPPIVDAGPDQPHSNGFTSFTLVGSVTAGSNAVTSHVWTQTHGTTLNISKPNDLTTIVTGASPDSYYEFTLTATDAEGLTASDVVGVTFGNPAPDPPDEDDTASYQIVVDTSARFWKGDTVFYQVNDINGSGGMPYKLFDEQHSEIPTTEFTSGYSSQMYYPAIAVVDLGGLYKLTKISYYCNYGADSLNFLYGEPFNWNDTIRVRTNGQTWRDVTDTIYTRYLKIFYQNKSSSQHVYEVKLYGHLVGDDSLSRIDPEITVSHTQNTMGQFMGFNHIGPSDVDSVGEMMRHYMQYEWMDTVTMTHVVDDIQYVFSIFGEPNGEQNLQYYFFPYGPGEGPVKSGYTGRWGEQFDAFQGVPEYLKDIGLVKPIDPVLFPDRDSTNAMEYTRLSRLCWTYAATFGKETYPEDSVQTPYPEKTGLAIRNFVETGNEDNQDWSGKQGYWSPKAFIAKNSAMYDGNLGKMGSRMGFKNADPSMTVVMGGTAGIHPDYLQGLQYYSYYTREDHSVPFDVVNFHFYPTNGVNGSGTEPHASSPENYMADRGQAIYDYIKLSNELMPGKKIWATEWGWDRNGASPLSVPQFGGLDSAQVQAQWTARMWFILSFSGLDRSTIFQLHNDPIGTIYDTAGVYKFNTTGLADGIYVGNKYSEQNATSWYAYPVYYFQRTIWQRLYNYKPDSIIVDNVDSIYVFKYRNADYPDSVAYAVWSGTMTNRSTSAYKVKIGQANSATRVVQLADKHFLGIESAPETDASGNLAMTISETPHLVFALDDENGGELVGGEPVDEPPTANAGSDQTITLPTNSVTLSGSGTAGSSDITSHTWSKVSGTGGNISDPTSYTTSVTGLTEGTYVYKLVVEDENGLSDEDQVTVTVNPEPVVVPPTADAGEDQSITLPTSSITLSGSGTSGSSAITSHVWTKVSGAGGTITSPNNYNTTVVGLTEGDYVFRLTVTDEDDETGTDDVTVTVNAEPVVTPPTAHAGSDQSLAYTATSTNLSGNATEGDAPIESYAWEQTAGPTVNIEDAASAETEVTGLSAGHSYIFTLTVTDENGETGSDNVTVVVADEPAPPTDNKLTFRWIRYYDDFIILIYQDQNGKYYSVKIKK